MAAAASGAAVSRLTADEAAVYDRQIRVWGVEAQRRMRDSHVVVLGLRGLGAEVCKNLALAGIGALTLVDDGAVCPEDLACNFFLSEADVGRSRAAQTVPRLGALNPHVRIDVLGSAKDLLRDEALRGVSVVVLCEFDAELALQLNSACRARAAAPAFVFAVCAGFFGLVVIDLGKHEFTITSKNVDAMGREVEKHEQRALSFCSLRDVLSRPPAVVAAAFGKRLKNASSVFLCFKVLLELSLRERRRPRPSDAAALESARVALLQEAGLAASECSAAQLAQLATLSEAELSPVASVLGGQVAQEVLKAVSRRDEPLKNVLVYDALVSEAVVRDLSPA